MTGDGDGYSTILTERIGLVERITLNRPEKRNALNTLLQQELIDAVHAAERTNEVRVIVIRGAGPSFCSGYDINPGRAEAEVLRPQTTEQDVALTISYGQLWANLWNCRIPVIAQVHGYCIAGGSDLALHCDLVIAADARASASRRFARRAHPPRTCGSTTPGRSGRSGSSSPATPSRVPRRPPSASRSKPCPPTVSTTTCWRWPRTSSGIGHDLLVHNKRIVNLGVELMGRSQMQVLAAIHDTLAHQAPEAVSVLAADPPSTVSPRRRRRPATSEVCRRGGGLTWTKT